MLSSKSKEEKGIWQFFQGFYVLSIPSSPRKPQISKNLKEAGIEKFEIIDFEPASKTKNDSEGVSCTLGDIFAHSVCDNTCLNIAENHFKLIQRAKDNNLENVVIFEDDALFDLPINFNKIKEVTAWLSSNDWDIFYFGYCPWPLPFSVIKNKNIVKLYNPLCLHCYALSAKGINKILDAKKNFKDMHVDKFIGCNVNLNKYGIFPAISFQSDDPALFVRAQKSLPIKVSFRSISKILEIISIFMPIVLITIIIFILYKIKKKYL